MSTDIITTDDGVDLVVVTETSVEIIETSQGADGPQGPPGVDGAPGPAGADSTVPGPTGPQGDTGPQGLQGATGADSTVPGPQGIQGLQGPAGADSVVPGPQGPQGPQGDAGESAARAIDTSPPAGAVVGDFWWDALTGQLMILYDDGDSVQWVQTNSAPQGPAGEPGSSIASGVTFTPAGNIAATDVQAALVELDSEKAALTANTFTAAQRGTPVSLTSTAASTAINLALSNHFTHSTSENTTLAAPSNPIAGQSGVIVITQGAAARLLAYNTFWKFPGGTIPTLTATVGAVDVLAYYIESGTRATCQLLKDVK